MIEIDNETYAAVQTLGKDVVAELARGLVRARKLHPVFAESAAEGAAVVYTEASELVASVHDHEPSARQRAEAVDTAVTAIRYMGKFGVVESTGVRVDSVTDEELERLREAPAGLYEMMEQTAQEAPDVVEHPYSSLRKVLDDAYHQASKGKGVERHAGHDEPFDRQIICEVRRRVGPGYTKGQAVKKIYESDRLEGERGVAELLGAINYIAAEVIVRRETK